MHHAPPQQPFRQFRYPTLPLSVSADFKNRVLAEALARFRQMEEER